MNKWIRAAGIESDISSHGMRHTLGIDIAHADGNNFQIMSVLSHSSPRTAEIFTQEVNRRKLARQAA